MAIAAVTLVKLASAVQKARVPQAENVVVEMPGWWVLPPNYGLAWNDVDDASSVFVQLPNVGDQIAVHETGAGDSAWAFPIPDNL